MPAPLRIRLAPEEDFTLSQLQVATKVPQRTRKRAHMLRLKAQSKAMEARSVQGDYTLERFKFNSA